ncbi:MAG: hypothetical protein ACXWW0_00560 [Bacteroidia bacterium]
MKLLKNALPAIYVILAFISINLNTSTCFAQKNIMKLRLKPFYKEYNIIKVDTAFRLLQIVTFDKPHVIDESYSYILEIKFLDTSIAREKKMLDISQDTNIIKVGLMDKK